MIKEGKMPQEQLDKLKRKMREMGLFDNPRLGIICPSCGNKPSQCKCNGENQ